MINQKVLEKYRKAREDHVARFAGNGRVYHHKVRAEDAYRSAKRYVRITDAWEKAVEMDRVKIEESPDQFMTVEEYIDDDDAYKPELHPDIQSHVIERQRKEAIDQIENEGIWVISGLYSQNGIWVCADSIGGFVGNSWEDSGYDLDIMATTLDAIGLLPKEKQPERDRIEFLEI